MREIAPGGSDSAHPNRASRIRLLVVAAVLSALVFLSCVAWIGRPFIPLFAAPGFDQVAADRAIRHADFRKIAMLAEERTGKALAREIARQQLALHEDLSLHGVGTQLYTAWNAPMTLKAVNWYGFEYAPFVPDGLDRLPLDTILSDIRSLGFNAIRLTFANETIESNPVISAGVEANPNLKGRHALDVMQEILARCQHFGLRLILVNMRSEAGRGPEFITGLWYTDRYPASSWVADWVTLVKRFDRFSSFVGADLRNEPHTLSNEFNNNGDFSGGPIWGGLRGTYYADRDWRYAAQTLGNTLLGIDPHLLIVIEGVQWYVDPHSNALTGTLWGSDLVGVQYDPIVLSRPSQLVYSPHEYGPHMWQADWFLPQTSYQTLAQHWDSLWGYLLTASKSLQAPIFVGEFGTCDDYSSCVSDQQGWKQGFWFKSFVRYLQQHPQIGWAYWSLNPLGPFQPNDRNFYGLLSPDWQHYYPLLTQGLAPLLKEPDGLWQRLYPKPASSLAPLPGCSPNASCTAAAAHAVRVQGPVAAPASATSVKVTPGIAYATGPARSRRGDLYQPQSGGLKAAVVLVHGGDWADGDKSGPDSTYLARALAFHGYVVFNINYRLVGHGGRFPKNIVDVKDAVAYLSQNAKRLGIDPRRIAAVGEGSGGYLAEMAAYTPNSGAFAPDQRSTARVAVVGSLFAPVQIPHTGGSVQDPASLNAAAAYLHVSYAKSPQTYYGASPDAFVNGSVPTIFFSGVSDRIHPFDQTYRFFQRISQRYKVTRLIDLPGSPESLSDLTPKRRDQIVATLEGFLDNDFRSTP